MLSLNGRMSSASVGEGGKASTWVVVVDRDLFEDYDEGDEDCSGGGDDGDDSDSDDFGGLFGAAAGAMFEEPEREEEFKFSFALARHEHEKGEQDGSGCAGGDDKNCVELVLHGIREDLGQTLNSTGLTVWRASHYLCDFISASSFQAASGATEVTESDAASLVVDTDRLHVRGKRVVELGAGLGLVSLLCACAGAARTVCTDGDRSTLERIARNCEVNARTLASPIRVSQLVWGREAHVKRIAGYAGSGWDKRTGKSSSSISTANATAAVVDSALAASVSTDAAAAAAATEDVASTAGAAAVSTATVSTASSSCGDDGDKGFDLVIGSDIIYDEQYIAPLLDTATALLRKETATATATARARKDTDIDTARPAFVLSFSRRQVPFSAVVEAAAERGLEARASYDGKSGAAVPRGTAWNEIEEGVWTFTWATQSEKKRNERRG